MIKMFPPKSEENEEKVWRKLVNFSKIPILFLKGFEQIFNDFHI